ncbi:siderophore-interacting protein [Streptomyces sulfonofaciens]|uniref:Siderophore-interacting protein n=1 Tax=Streptomyces sulfonofaciens TaxID=68272 RepID=A0A919GEM2_9ACTN|nr:siderophore-interacting protein [Streptomyces sulfonofaciens]GHH83135.1 siderophore-interacting protein [Streptomyces sulfonofaciens]
MTTAVAAPFRFFALHVLRTRRLGPSMVRITFGGADLSAFASGGRDQSLSLFLPHPGQPAPVVPVAAGEGWWRAWRQLPEHVRAVMRSYTVRAQRPAPGGGTEIDIDFALHGQAGHPPAAQGPQGPTAHEPHEPHDRATHAPHRPHGPTAHHRSPALPHGPAARWAARARPGDRALVLGPVVEDNSGVRFRPPAGTDLVVLYADETALPALAAILESLPAGLPVRAWCEVADAADVQELPTAADARITWLVRGRGAPTAAEAVGAAPLPACTAPYAWVAGESGQVKAVRGHLVTERGFDRGRVTFVGYWRRGLSEEQLRARARA